jgi:hypothetical protein
MTSGYLPPTLSSELHRIAAAELSRSARVGYVALLMAALTMTLIVAALWLTEPRLPGRTALAFSIFIVIGLSWASFAAWVLTHKRVLLARHRIVAGRLAVVFSTVFAVGALAVSVSSHRPAGFAAAGLGVVLMSVAGVMLVRAERAFSRLTERRSALERELGNGGQA